MAAPLDILILEDVAADAELALHELTRRGVACGMRRVESEAGLRAALAAALPDLILSDFALPGFDGLAALAIARELAPHTPFIFVSGHIGEEQAIEAMKQGATDYVLKGNLKRLAPAVERARREAAECAARRRAERELVDSQARFALFMRHLPGIAFIKDRAGRYLYLNEATARLVRRSAAEVVDRTDFDVWPREIAERLRASDEATLDSGQPLQVTHQLPHGDDMHHWLTSKFPIPYGEADEVLLGGIGIDITERKQQEARLAWLANHDALTGLPNRNLLVDRLEQALAHARRAQRTVAVAMADMDRFKLVNDSLGHDKGDLLLKGVGRQLSRAVREGDTVARLGGDEFVVVMSDLAQEQDIPLVLDKLGLALARPFPVAGHDIYASASIGVACFPKDGETGHDLLRNADAAMYRAKEGAGPYCFYSPYMNARLANRLTLENKLRRALERGEFVLHYQPKLDLKSGRIRSLEALLRWNDPEAGLVPPARLIPILEETGMVVEVGRWAMARAAEDQARWRAGGVAPCRVAINVSSLQLRRPDFVATVTEILDCLDDPAPGLALEITESLLIEDLEATIAKLRALRERGLKIAIDDFGTGHSSLSYIARLPIDELKIDRSFVCAMAADPTHMAIVSTIISLAHSLDLTVVAEGVETEDQAKLLRLLRCDEAQGHLYHPAVPAERIAALLARG